MSPNSDRCPWCGHLAARHSGPYKPSDMGKVQGTGCLADGCGCRRSFEHREGADARTELLRRLRDRFLAIYHANGDHPMTVAAEAERGYEELCELVGRPASSSNE